MMSQTQTQSVGGSERDASDVDDDLRGRREADHKDACVSTLLDIAERALKTKLSPDDDLLSRSLSVNRALRIISDVWRATGTELDVNIFYRRRSVAALAEAIDQGLGYSEEKLVLIRDGDRDKPLFCYPGGANCFLEMRDLVSALPFGGAVYGLAVTPRPFHPNVPPTVEREVRDALISIRRIQPRGPYRIIGFSFGGVLALEAARALQAEGETIDYLGMLDSPLSDHCLSTTLWLKLMAKIICRQALSRLAALRRHRFSSKIGAHHGRDIPSSGRKGHRLMLRFLSPAKPDYHLYNPQWTDGFPPRYSAMGAQVMRMKGLYQPRRYEGKTNFFTSRGGSPIDCSSRDVWTPYLGDVEWADADGTHLSMLVGRHGKALAEKIGERL